MDQPSYSKEIGAEIPYFLSLLNGSRNPVDGFIRMLFDKTTAFPFEVPGEPEPDLLVLLSGAIAVRVQKRQQGIQCLGGETLFRLILGRLGYHLPACAFASRLDRRIEQRESSNCTNRGEKTYHMWKCNNETTAASFFTCGYFHSP